MSDSLLKIVNPTGLTEADLAVALLPRRRGIYDLSLSTKKVSLGLARQYPGLRSVVIYCERPEGGSARRSFFAAEGETPRLYCASPAAGSNIHNALVLASQLQVRALALVDVDLLSVKTTWIKSLFEPILKQEAEYVAPLYLRHKNEALLTNWLAYPLFRSLFGRRALQPIDTDRAFSRRLLEIYKAADFKENGRGYASDLKFLSLAVMEQARLCQSFIAHPRIAAGIGDDPTEDLPAAAAELIRSFFELMAATRGYWLGVTRSRPTALAGADEEIKTPLPQIELNIGRLAERFVEWGLKSQDLWDICLSPLSAAALKRELRGAAAGRPPRVSLDLWRVALYEASAAYAQTHESAEALVPVFLARCLTGLEEEARNFNARLLDAQAEAAALNFENAKGDLAALWQK